MRLEHVSKADPEIWEKDESGAAIEVDQHQVEPTLWNNKLRCHKLMQCPYLWVGG